MDLKQEKNVIRFIQYNILSVLVVMTGCHRMVEQADASADLIYLNL